MLINEIRDFSKDVPEKKIILDQLGPRDTAELVLQIASYSALDSVRLDKNKNVDEVGVDNFIEEVIDNLNRISSKTYVQKALKSAKEGKV
jgi:hypothetical protein